MGVMEPWGRTRQSIGAFGEDVVVRYLLQLGWLIVARNWRHPGGELDIVARDGRDLVICEVKTRRGLVTGDPVEAVTPLKHRRLRQLARAWVDAHPDERAGHVRIDVLGVVLWSDRGEIHHLREVVP
jgi:putative endonuclease